MTCNSYNKTKADAEVILCVCVYIYIYTYIHAVGGNILWSPADFVCLPSDKEIISL